MSRRRKHEGTYADAAEVGPGLVLQVVGHRPKYRPYLAISRPGVEPREVIATVDNANALRGLANAILRSLDEPSEEGA